MKEEKFIRKKYGHSNPFKVPEGYFEHFTADLMSKLPEYSPSTAPSAPTIRLHRRRIIGYAAAAALCGCMILGASHHYFTHRTIDKAAMSANSEAPNTEDVYMNDVLDYAMVSNEEIAQYLTDAH
ncbi:MAG: hypothetical protein LUC45_01250 [Paraprevotella sp.]|nr:hypothetical protein [Paraprevotella sp.]